MVAFSIFGFSVYRYGIFYALAFLLGYLGLARIGKQNYFSKMPKLQSLLTDHLEDLILVIALGVIIGGRLGHILIYSEGYYFANPTAILKIREGGMSFIGGIMGVVSSVYLYLKVKKLT